MAPFHHLVDTIKSNLLVTHGKDAADCLSLHGEIISVPHFSRGWSEEKAIDLGRALQAIF